MPFLKPIAPAPPRNHAVRTPPAVSHKSSQRGNNLPKFTPGAEICAEPAHYFFFNDQTSLPDTVEPRAITPLSSSTTCAPEIA